MVSKSVVCGAASIVKRTTRSIVAGGHEQLEKRSGNRTMFASLHKPSRSVVRTSIWDDMIATTHTDAGLLRYPRDIDRNVAGNAAPGQQEAACP